MTEKLSFGKQNLGGELVNADLDEKNFTTDWIDSFLFEDNCVTNPDYEEEKIGYIRLVGSNVICRCTYSRCDNWVRYNFELNWLDESDVKSIIEAVQEFFCDNDNLEVEIIFIERKEIVSANTFMPEFVIYFKHRS